MYINILKEELTMANNNGGYFKIRASKDALGKKVMKILMKMFGSAIEKK